ncbi:MAG: MerR family transcriptional regulator [Deltaproteobacteria bacterium]|nr:MerR family transcriptional regulator [Deltaproteobacteria bacterium]MBP2687286.1 MerR family transcriptional regulator [Deltaproteobacteria bacterium]MBP2689069.1 MerR family transcriptional regulator [Deltaproteobacteria bacterium]MBS1245167.1 MerR family transcriptional regulator [Deltaproteobacteria bacterium]
MARAAEGTYAIGEISRMVDLSQRTIRYYEEIGLLHSVRRIENGKRVYTDNDVRRLKFINRLKVLGLSLAEMVELEKIYRKQRNNREILPKLLEILDERAGQIDERVAQLVALKKEIREYQQRLRNKVLQDATQEDPGTTGKEMHS